MSRTRAARVQASERVSESRIGIRQADRKSRRKQEKLTDEVGELLIAESDLVWSAERDYS